MKKLLSVFLLAIVFVSFVFGSNVSTYLEIFMKNNIEYTKDYFEGKPLYIAKFSTKYKNEFHVILNPKYDTIMFGSNEIEGFYDNYITFIGNYLNYDLFKEAYDCIEEKRGTVKITKNNDGSLSGVSKFYTKWGNGVSSIILHEGNKGFYKVLLEIYID